MTYQYLGINLKDQDETMQSLDGYINSLTLQKKEILGVSQWVEWAHPDMSPFFWLANHENALIS